MSTGQAVQLITLNNDGSAHVTTYLVSRRHLEIIRLAYGWLLGAPSSEALADADAIAELREVGESFVMMDGDTP